MKTYIKDMTKGNPTGLLLTFMFPMVVGNVFQQMYNLVDSMIVGKYVGADALAAVGATSFVNFLFFSLCGGMANGIGIVISRNFGAGNDSGVKKAIFNAAGIMLVTGATMGVLGILLSEPALFLLNTPENIMDQSVRYMRIMSAGILAVALYNCVSAILRAVGDSRTPLYFLVVASLLNIGLDLFFVRILNAGVTGAGIATIIAQFLAGVGSLVFAMARNPYFRIERELRRMDRVITGQCVRMGVPLALQTSMIAISGVILQSVVNTFGSVVVAAFTATGRIEQLVQQPGNSLCVAMATYTGQNMGADRLERVRSGFRKGCLIMGIFSLIMLPLAWSGGELVMGMFVNETEVIAFGVQALRITSWFYLPLGMIYVARGTLNGAGDAAFAFANGLVEMIGRICFAKPLTGIPAIGVWGIWLATGLTWFITGAFSVARYYLKIGRRKQTGEKAVK